MPLARILQALIAAGVSRHLIEQTEIEQRGQNLSLAERYLILGGCHTMFANDADCFRASPEFFILDTLTCC